MASSSQRKFLHTLAILHGLHAYARLQRIYGAYNGLKNLTENGWGNLHGPAFKAAITRNASGFIKDLAAEFLGGGDDFEKCMARLAADTDECYKALWGKPRFLSDKELSHIETVYNNFGVSYMECREGARRRNFLGFEVTPKVHKTQHIPLMSKIINPTAVQCYAEESLVGTTTRTWKMSMSGRYKKGGQRKVLLKRFCGLMLRLDDS